MAKSKTKMLSSWGMTKAFKGDQFIRDISTVILSNSIEMDIFSVVGGSKIP